MARRTTSVALATLGLMALMSVPAEAQVKTGSLVCDVSAGVGLIVASKKAVACTFTATDGRKEFYNGYISKIGIDVGVTSGGTIVWAVFEPTSHKNTLGGTYAGATAQATVVAGLGANVLVGGSRQSVALQPLSVSGQTGLNLAAGIGALTLQRTK
jgi:hypothetical protein